MSQSISSKIQNEIIQEYLSGKSLRYLSKTYNISIFIIKKIFFNNSIQTRIIKKSLSSENIVNDYKSGKYIREIARNNSVDPYVICRILKENNIKIEQRTWRKHIINEKYFDNIDSEDKAYFLGLLFADGCVSKNGYNICLVLKNNDKHILENFAKFIYENPDNIIFDRASKQKPYSTYSHLNINSLYMSNILRSYGCVSAKSLILKYPNNIREDLQQHFIRGYFDGDGMLNIKHRMFNITSTENFCNKVKEILEYNTNSKLQIIKYKNIYRCTSHGRNNITNILNFLYKDASIYLNRKYELYQQLLIEPTVYFSDLEINNFISLKNDGYSYNKIAKIYNCSDGGVKKAILRRNK